MVLTEGFDGGEESKLGHFDWFERFDLLQTQSGPLSRKMLERYSYTQNEAKVGRM
jgi:hypothetical protein